MSGAAPTPDLLRIADLPAQRPTAFHLEPSPEARAALAQSLDAQSLRKLRFEGTLRPIGKRDWALEAKLGATAVQTCVATLAPVTTRIDTPVRRMYLADYEGAPLGDEVEMPEDDTREPLPEVIDLSEVMAEALALALPDYPRADGAEIGAIAAAPPGAAPLSDEGQKPFAALAALRDRLPGTDPGADKE